MLSEAEAKEGLQNVAPILALLGGRLKQRDTPWYQLFDALLLLAGSPLSSDSVTKQVGTETRDDTRQALDAVWEEEQVKFIEDNATACDSSPLQNYQRRFSGTWHLSMSTSAREARNDTVPERLFTISTRTCAARYLSSAVGYAMTTGNTHGEPLPARCWTNAAWCYGQTCSTSAFWGSFRALVWHVNPALDVCPFLPIAVKQQMAMIAGGLCGVLTLVGGAGLLVRRLTNPRIRATSSTADILILCVLLIQCILGLTTIPFSAQHPDGSEMLKLVGWAQSVVTFEGGASAHLDGVALIFRVHLVLGMTIFLLFPFTRPFTCGVRRLSTLPAAIK